MKIKTCLWFYLILGGGVMLSAQTLFTDPLAPPNVNWTNSPVNQGGGTLEFFNNGTTAGLGYAVTASTAKDTGYRSLTTFAAPTTSGWAAQVDVHLVGLSGLTPGQYANLNLIVAKASDGNNFNTSLALDRYNSGGGVIMDVDTFVTTGGASSHLPEVLDATTFATLAISYDPLSSRLFYAYDADGPVNGVAFTLIHTVDISAWAMGPTDSFAFLLVGGSGVFSGGGTGPGLAVTDAYFQNFTVSALAVPEPSTYTLLLAGAVGLLATVRLRRRAGR